MNYRLILFILMLLPHANTMGQNTVLARFIDCIEAQYGADNLLINGRPYFPANPQIKGHPYFETKEWKPGTVYINGRAYPADNLKYSLLNDQLIIQHTRSNGITQKVIASSALVDSFQIGDHFFVNRGLILPEQEKMVYVEKIFDGKLSFFRFQQKVLGSQTPFAPYGRYSDLRDVFFLVKDKEYYRITKRRNFLASFPEHKKEIKKYMREHSLKWRKMTKPQYVQLLKFCNDKM